MFTNEAIKPFGTWAIFGKRRSGKTGWSRFLCSRFPNTTCIMVITDSEDCASEWKRVIPSVFIMVPDINKLEKIAEYQNMNNTRHLVMVFDDCGADTKFMNSKIINILFSNGRHYGLTLLFALQTFNQLHLRNRTNLDYVCLLNSPNQTILQKLHTEFGGTFTKKYLKQQLQTSIMEITCDDSQAFDQSVQRGMCIIDNTNCQSTRLFTLNHSEYQYNNPQVLFSLPQTMFITPYTSNQVLPKSLDHCLVYLNGKRHKIYTRAPLSHAPSAL